MTETAAERREVYYSGRVQGVGFRYTVRSLAARYAVTGFVRNLPDGRVHLVVEGAVAEVRAFLEAVMGAVRGHVTGRDERTTPARGEFRGFEIRG